MGDVTTIQITDFANIYTKGLSDSVLLLDVRTPVEYNEEHLNGAINVPLDELETQLDTLSGYNLVYIYCRTGSRSYSACERLAERGFAGVINLHGGVVAWKEQNHSIHTNTNISLSIDRQVKLIAGSLILTSLLLASVIHPAFLGLALFVGSGLTFAGSSGICFLAILLARMPWNHQPLQCAIPEFKSVNHQA